MNTDEEQKKIDIAVLQSQVIEIHKVLENVETNHLPHIYKRLGNIETKMAWYAGAIVAVGSIIQLVITYFVK